MTASGSSICDIEVKRDTVSELLRLYLGEREEGGLENVSRGKAGRSCEPYLLFHSEPTPPLPPPTLLPHPPPPTTLLQILLKLKTHPLQSLRPSEKVSIFSVLIEDLLGSPALCREVDTKMEQISTLRRGKWKINLKLKRYWGVGGE